MPKFKMKTKNKFKKILCAILCVGCVIALGAGLSALTKSETKTIGASAFSVGALDENGKYVADKQSIYTKDAFECLGLRIEPDFEAKLTYDVYYYDYNEKLLEVKRGLTEIYDEDFPLAKLARVVIHPAIPEGETVKSFKIDYLSKIKFANELKVTVNKNQNYLYNNSVNLYVADDAELGKSFNSDAAVLALVENTANKVTEKIIVSGDYEYYDIFVKKTADATSAAVAIANAEDNNILARELANLTDVNDGEWCKITISVPELDAETSAYLIVRMAADADAYIFGYNK